MKRREALGTLIVASAGALLAPGCDSTVVPTYRHFVLDRGQWHFLTRFLDALLPSSDLVASSPESVSEFVLTMVDDCHDLDDIQRFQAGLAGLMTYCKEHSLGTLKKLDEAKTEQLFGQLSSTESAEMTFFYATARRYAIQHFTSSEHFMKQYLDFEFAPGRYEACLAL